LHTVALTFDMILVLGILAMTVLLSVSNVIRVDVVAVLVLAILGVTRLLPPESLFSGFSSEAVMSLIAVMIIGTGLEKSGIVLRIARWILRTGRERPNKINFVLMCSSGILSAFMRSLGTVALLLPVVTRITIRTGIPKSRLLIPVAFCSILGGTLSMIGTSPLILLNSLIKNSNQFIETPAGNLQPFHLFSVFPIGLFVLTLGILYLMLVGRRLLPKEPLKNYSSSTTKSHFHKIYGKGGDFFEVQVLPNSDLIGLDLRELENRLDLSSSILVAIKGKEVHFPPQRNVLLEAHAWFAIMGHKDVVVPFAEKHGLKLAPRLNLFAELLHTARSGLCEAVVPPSSQLIGCELRELHMKRTHQLNVLALYRGQTLYAGEALRDLVLRSGDTLGMFCEWEALADFDNNPDFVVVTTAYPREELRPEKAKYGLLFLTVSLMLIVFGHFPVSVGLLLGASGMIATGVLSIDEAYESVSWKTVFLIAGLIPLGLAMQATHTSDWLTQYVLVLKEGVPLFVVELGLAIFTTMLAFFLSNVGATIVLVPIALELAMHLNADPRIFALIVALAASNTFMMPNQQVNALIAGPGGYSPRDFFRIGGGMTILYWFAMLISINLVF
jgi:di/tricarboxylate transporter